MGSCVSTPGPALSEAEKQRHRAAERQLKEAKQAMDSQVKVLLLGSGDSGKSTILKVCVRLVLSSLSYSRHLAALPRSLIYPRLTAVPLEPS
jgi:guanine nucleotide-binding protein subunit alpha, other